MHSNALAFDIFLRQQQEVSFPFRQYHFWQRPAHTGYPTCVCVIVFLMPPMEARNLPGPLRTGHRSPSFIGTTCAQKARCK